MLHIDKLTSIMAGGEVIVSGRKTAEIDLRIGTTL
jgi:hypothetical protein